MLFNVGIDETKTELQRLTFPGVFTIVELPYGTSRYLFLKYIMT